MAWGIVITGFTMVGMLILVVLKENLTVLAGPHLDAGEGKAAALKSRPNDPLQYAFSNGNAIQWDGRPLPIVLTTLDDDLMEYEVRHDRSRHRPCEHDTPCLDIGLCHGDGKQRRAASQSTQGQQNTSVSGAGRPRGLRDSQRVRPCQAAEGDAFHTRPLSLVGNEKAIEALVDCDAPSFVKSEQ